MTTLLLMAPTARAQPSFEEIVRQVNDAAPTLTSFVADQVIDLRFLGVWRWRITATVYARRPGTYRIILHDPPGFFRALGRVFSDATSPEQILVNYRAVSVRPGEGSTFVAEVVGVTAGINPPAGQVTVDSDRWVITQTILRYAWGKVTASYRYANVGSYYLPVAIRVVVPSFALEAEIVFKDYRLNEPLPAKESPGVSRTAV